MRLTTRTNLAMRVLMYCAANPGRTARKQEIAEVCNASENHLAQVIHLLGKKGFIKTQRGRLGGLTLAHAPEDIRIGTVFRSLESVLPFAECFAAEKNTCPLAGVCRLQCVMVEALDAFYARLDQSTLADLVSGNGSLQKLLKAA